MWGISGGIHAVESNISVLFLSAKKDIRIPPSPPEFLLFQSLRENKGIHAHFHAHLWNGYSRTIAEVDERLTCSYHSLPFGLVERKWNLVDLKIEWIKPRVAVNMIAPFVGGDSKAKILLAERFRDGAITLSTMYFTESVDIGPVPIIHVDSEIEESKR